MRIFNSKFLFACLVGVTAAVGCGGDDSPDDGPSGGKGGQTGTPEGGAEPGSGGKTSSGGKSSGGKSGGDAGDTSTGGVTGEGGGGVVPTEGGAAQGGGGPGPVPTAGAGGGDPVGSPCNIYDADRPIEDIPTLESGDIEVVGDTLTLTSDKTWRLKGRSWLPSGKTLEIEPCTLVVGTPRPSAGALFITRGAKLIANGTADRPIVFSSEDQKFNANAPWGGIVLFGYAPLAHPAGSTQEALYEGLTDERSRYGGEDPDDNSGSLSYVRIEYGGDIIVGDKEINGLSFGGVGRGTSVHHIMVKRQLDDCFEWFGGTVNASHLICENSGDDMFDTDSGYKGHLQFLFGRLTTQGSSTDPSGFEWDGNQSSQTYEDRGTPKATNATLCGLGEAGASVSYGAVLRRALESGTSVQNTIITGFSEGIDVRDGVGTLAAPVLSVTHSLFFDNFTNNIAIATEATDDDNGFDELAWIKAEDNSNTDGAEAPEGFDCYANPPHPFPNEAIEGTSPADPFEDADYVGAFRDADDNWMTGAWVDWSSGS